MNRVVCEVLESPERRDCQQRRHGYLWVASDCYFALMHRGAFNASDRHQTAKGDRNASRPSLE